MAVKKQAQSGGGKKGEAGMKVLQWKLLKINEI
jgi:hypothetical protein